MPVRLDALSPSLAPFFLLGFEIELFGLVADSERKILLSLLATQPLTARFQNLLFTVQGAPVPVQPFPPMMASLNCLDFGAAKTTEGRIKYRLSAGRSRHIVSDLSSGIA